MTNQTGLIYQIPVNTAGEVPYLPNDVISRFWLLSWTIISDLRSKWHRLRLASVLCLVSLRNSRISRAWCLRLQEYLTQTYTGLLRNQHHVAIALTEELNNERRDV